MLCLLTCRAINIVTVDIYNARDVSLFVAKRLLLICPVNVSRIILAVNKKDL